MPKTINTTGDRGMDREIDALWREINSLKLNKTAQPSEPTIITYPEKPTRFPVGATVNPNNLLTASALLFDSTDGFSTEEYGTGAKVTLTILLPIETADPGTPQTGEIWVRGDLSELRIWNGTEQVKFGATVFDFERLNGTGETLASSQANIYQRVIDDAATPQTLTLPDPTTHTRPILIRALNAPAGGHTVARDGAENIDGVAADLTIGTVAGQLQSILLVSDGTDWYSLQQVLA